MDDGFGKILGIYSWAKNRPGDPFISFFWLVRRRMKLGVAGARDRLKRRFK